MVTTQVADVSEYPNDMDTPQDSDSLTFGMLLKYLGMLFAAIFTFIAAWVGKKLFGYISSKLEEDMKEVKDTMNQIKDFVSKIADLEKNDERLEKNDAAILLEIADIKNRLTAVEQKMK